ncbi:uncharacterized protein LOC131245031 [Magnolia sinica]|uniref:uncharacterized protein LOC131245031 n=1 Tax=Magnolia sinica TaxID=86752 RepID=UPI0026582641|nr:uncharacterized protein LOC131245031 [Magnolia sinica]
MLSKLKNTAQKHLLLLPPLLLLLLLLIGMMIWTVVVKLGTKRRTWVALFVLVYALLLSSSWNLIRSILTWYSSSTIGLWPALYASLLFGGVFGLLSMAAAFAIVLPATVVTWITVLVLLAFAGKPRRSLVVEARKITADITTFAIKIVLREGNIVAAAAAILSFLALFRSSRNGGTTTDSSFVN